MNFPILQDESVILKQLTREYGVDVLKHFSNEEVNKFVDFDKMSTIEETNEIIDWGLSLFKNNNGILWGIFRKSDNVFMGQLNYVLRVDNNFEGKKHRAEIGFDLSPSFWGNGYMSASIKLANNYVFNEMGMNRIEAIVHPLNTRAHTTLRKIGFSKEGILREYVLYHNNYWDMVLFSLLKKEIL